uniref:Centrosomal protein of 162 kDa n=1 Tax=Anabas testudineus TaxID=64144 RepID=A0A3Q1KI59_ANATE
NSGEEKLSLEEETPSRTRLIVGGHEPCSAVVIGKRREKRTADNKNNNKQQKHWAGQLDSGDVQLQVGDTLMAPAVKRMSVGLDTLEEEEEKARFFAQLEAGSSSIIDYSKLNRELDSTSSTIGTNLRYGICLGLILTYCCYRIGTVDSLVHGQLLYSISYCDYCSPSDHLKFMLDCISLSCAGLSHIQSGGSEMEALHEAYRQIHVVEDSDDHSPHYRPVSPSSPPQHTRRSLQPASTNESELPTAEELMKPIRPEKDHIRGFTLQPVRLEQPNQIISLILLSEQHDLKVRPTVVHSDKELRAQLAQKEQQLQMMKEDAKELHSIRQQNYLLQSKLRSAEEESQKKRLAQVTDSTTEEKFQQIDKEIKEQEMLIKGYQQENEKLYLQLKGQQAKGKANEEAMFNENQRLLTELASAREQLNKTSRPVGNVCLMDHTQRITDLLRNEAKLSDHIRTLKQEKQALEVDLQLMKKERDLAKAQVTSTSGDKTFEMRLLEDKHKEEVSALRKKLQWFAENQELLDKDAGRLKAATAEIHRLKEQVEQLKVEVGKRSNEQQRKGKDKSVDTKRMRDLERQVRELEQILRHRNPNSLPALIYAAASAGSQENAGAPTASPPGRVTALLERRIQRLEAELESHDEEAKHSLRAMEQQFHRIKLRYEQRISELELELQQKQQVDVTTAETEPRVSRVQSLEEELQLLKETYQQKEKGLCDQIEALHSAKAKDGKCLFVHTDVISIPLLVQQSPGRHQRQAEAAFGVRIERLNQELTAKTRTIQELSRTVARLQKERTSVPPVPSPRPETRSLKIAESIVVGVHLLPGSHISEVLQENETLRQRLELLQVQNEQEREALKAEAAREHSAEQISSMKEEQLRVLDHLRATYALEHSSSKVAELTNELNTQKIMVKHLQEQLTELQGAKDALAISRTREDALQKQLTKLLMELKEAKEAQSSEVKLLCSLERKLLNMEFRHQHREKELQQVISGSWQTPEANQQSEVERWRRLAQDKSKELEAFRLELDSILDILRHLQKQGVVFPAPDHQQVPRGAQTLIGVSGR